MIGHHTAQMLKFFGFVLDRCLQPVFAVKIHHDAALVKPMVAVKLRLHHEGKILLLRFHLQHGCIIIAEMIIGPLPQICIGCSDNLNFIGRNRTGRRFSHPFQFVDIKFHITSPFQHPSSCRSRQQFPYNRRR